MSDVVAALFVVAWLACSALTTWSCVNYWRSPHYERSWRDESRFEQIEGIDVRWPELLVVCVLSLIPAMWVSGLIYAGWAVWNARRRVVYERGEALKPRWTACCKTPDWEPRVVFRAKKTKEVDS